MTLPPLLPLIGEAARFWYCQTCREATYHNEDGTCKECGTKTPHIPRGEEPNGKHTRV